MELSPQEFFRVPRRLLVLFGIWPMSSKSLPFFFYINLISLICTASVITFFGFTNRQSIKLVLDSLTPSITEAVSAIKMCMLFYYRKDFRKILQKLFDLYIGGECDDWRLTIDGQCSVNIPILFPERSPAGVKIYKKSDSYAAMVVSTLCFFGFATCTTYILTPLLYNLYFYFTNQPLVRDLPFKA